MSGGFFAAEDAEKVLFAAEDDKILFLLPRMIKTDSATEDSKNRPVAERMLTASFVLFCGDKRRVCM